MFTNIGTAAQSFVWDGRDDHGVIRPAGWYTVRVTLSDQIGHTNFATRLVQIGDLAGLARFWPIRARTQKSRCPDSLGSLGGSKRRQLAGLCQRFGEQHVPVLKLTTGTLAQENPRTDGRYVVWQGRQADGSWDLYLHDLTTTNAPVH